jgi:Zn-dependent protease with chaperone function
MLPGRSPLVWFAILFLAILAPRAAARQPGPLPGAEEVDALLRKEPITLKSWPAWRGRLLAWVHDRGNQTDAAFLAAYAFVLKEAEPSGELRGALAGDALAWYLLGSAYLHQRAASREEANQQARRAEQALRRSLRLDPQFARAHRNLALALLSQGRGQNRLPEVEQALQDARRLDPSLPLHDAEAELAYRRGRYEESERILRAALEKEPRDEGLAFALARAIVSNKQNSTEKRRREVQALVDRFPDSGHLACMHGVALALDQSPRKALREFDRARSLGADPEQVVSPNDLATIEQNAAPTLAEWALWGALGFVGFYAAVMLLMAGFGLLLANRTRGRRALALLEGQPAGLVAEGQVVRVGGESALARLYALALFFGLLLFYAAIPFVIAGLLAATALVLYAVFLLPRIPVQLIVTVVLIGGGMAWAVFRSLFSKPSSGSFGIPKTAADCPRLHQAIAEVATRVDTDPVHEVFLAPGSAIGVHQEGRGPFGIFGVKRRVLTLGLSTLRFLSAGELRAILAHEYAHFSHKDTFYSRFIYQVHLSIEAALQGMGGSGGINYVNPFYWFLYLYYRSYSLLSAGFSRSREFLADRMASSLYGADVFASALTKVSTDGALFEMTVYQNIGSLLQQQQAFVNIYSAFQAFRDEQMDTKDREELYRKLLDEQPSVFASHPTFKERIDAVAPLPPAQARDDTPALQLLENPEEVEKELTQFLTEYMAYLQQLQTQAAQEAAQG